jgi:uncharacterized protein YecE (DUF72 family)
MACIRIGISGWRYAPWRGTFYPKDLAQKNELKYAASIFPSIEINGSFYSLQHPESYTRWYEHTPPGFLFAVKGGRFLTHMKKLRGVESALANFLASGLFNLREKLGPILWQFPENFRYDAERIESFLRQLPTDTAGALKIARGHDARLAGRAALSIDRNRPMRHAFEIRHESFCNPSFMRLLRKYNVSLVIAETARRFPMLEDVTADFVYMRLHGDKELYRSGYGDKALERWAARIRAWHQGSEPPDAHKCLDAKPPRARTRDIYCYFDNTDVKLRAPVDAQRLMKKLGVKRTVEPFQINKLKNIPERAPR